MWDHWYPCFGLLVMSLLGFKARVDSLFACFVNCTQWIPQSHLWRDTCWTQPKCQPSFFLLTYLQTYPQLHKPRLPTLCNSGKTWLSVTHKWMTETFKGNYTILIVPSTPTIWYDAYWKSFFFPSDKRPETSRLKYFFRICLIRIFLWLMTCYFNFICIHLDYWKHYLCFTSHSWKITAEKVEKNYLSLFDVSNIA